MFFVPAIVVAAASAASAAPLALQVQESVQQNLSYDNLEDKDAFFLFDIVKKIFGKRDLESLDHQEFARALAGIEDLDEEEKKAIWGAVAKWGVPVLGGLISGLPDLIHGKKGKRDQVGAGIDLEDKDAFFLFDIFRKIIGKRGLESDEDMSDDEKKAFWGAVAKWGIPIIGGIFSGMGSGSQKRDLLAQAQTLDLEDKDAFFLFDIVKKIFGKRDEVGAEIDVEDKDAFFLFDIVKKIFGKRDLESQQFAQILSSLSDEQKKAILTPFSQWHPYRIYPTHVQPSFSKTHKRDLYDLPTVPSAARRSVQDQGLLDALNDF